MKARQAKKMLQAPVMAPPPVMIEIARSASRKVNLGNYESMDFFCSAKKAVPEAEAEATSATLYLFCAKEVAKDVAAVKAGTFVPSEPEKHPVAKTNARAFEQYQNNQMPRSHAKAIEGEKA